MKKYIIAVVIALVVIVAVVAYFAGDREQKTTSEPTTAETQTETTAEETTAEVTEAETTASADDFNVMFTDIYFKYKKCVTIADSGKWIKVDSNPTDFPYYSNAEAEEAIEKINAVLGFDLTDTMLNTTKEDGRQSASNDKYVVAWTYSEEKGLEVTYAHRNGVNRSETAEAGFSKENLKFLSRDEDGNEEYRDAEYNTFTFNADGILMKTESKPGAWSDEAALPEEELQRVAAEFLGEHYGNLFEGAQLIAKDKGRSSDTNQAYIMTYECEGGQQFRISIWDNGVILWSQADSVQ